MVKIKKLKEVKETNVFEQWFKSPLSIEEYKKLKQNEKSIKNAERKYKKKDDKNGETK